MIPRILVLGAGYAGLLCATRLARRLGDRAQVTLVSASPHFVERIRHHQHLCGDPATETPLAALLGPTGARLVCGTVRAVAPARRQVLVDTVDTVDTAMLGYDRLVLALGSATDTSSIPGVADHALSLDAGAVAAGRQRLARLADGGRALVCGAGLTGIEAATELAERFPRAQVTLLAAARIDTGLSAAGARHLRGVLARLRVSVLEHSPVRALAKGEAQLDQDRQPFDVCLWTGGFRASPLVAAAGLATNRRGQALVDEHLRSTSHPEVLVIGDAADPGGAAVGSPIHMSCKTALPMGAHAADSLAAELLGQAPSPFRFTDAGVCISLGRADGLIQLRRGDGSPADRVFVGGLGARLKELVCRYTLLSLRLERRPCYWGYRWPRPALSAGQPRRLAA